MATTARTYAVRGATAGLDPVLVSRLERFANEVAHEDIIVYSGKRSAAHNRAVGGVTDSQHLTGDAVDARTSSGRLLGTIAAPDVFAKFGLLTGNVANFFNGKPDPGHVGLSTTSSSGGGTTSSSSIQNPDDFWYAVETALGAKHDRATHDFLVSWSIAENTKATNNPLATTLKLPGSTGLSGNPDGVQQYATPEQGVAATAQTIKGYPSILAALRRGVSFGSLSSPSITRELNIWSGHRSAGATVTDYVRNILLNFQGNPNANSASDWFSYDAGNLAHDAKTVLDKVAPWASGLTSLIGNLLNPNTWRRIALVIAGAVLVMAGMFLVARNAGAGAVG